MKTDTSYDSNNRGGVATNSESPSPGTTMETATATKAATTMTFYDKLASASPIYAKLRSEKQRRKTCPIVQAIEAQRREYFAATANNNNNHNNSSEQDQQGESRGSTNRSTYVVKTPNPRPYRLHYQKILPKKLFVTAQSSSSSNNPLLLFADIGCAPGGLCQYLLKDITLGCRWSCHAFSLSPKRGGFKMMYKGNNLGTNGRSLHYEDYDMSLPHTYKDLIERVRTIHVRTTTTSIDDGGGGGGGGGGDERPSRSSSSSSSTPCYRIYDFVNLGVTLQWQPPPPPPPSPETATSTEEAGRTEVVDDDDDDEEVGTSTSRNHRLTLQEILRNELVFALETIKDGGSIMVTLPTSDHPNTFLYLSYLRNCIKTTTVEEEEEEDVVVVERQEGEEGKGRRTQEQPRRRRKIRIFPTPKATRNPVYVFVPNIDVNGRGIHDFLHFLKSTDVIPENDSKWSLPNWEGYAESIFQSCKRDLEHVWKLQLNALQNETRWN